MPSPFVYAAGTNGYTAGPTDLLTTELNALAIAGIAPSTVIHGSGKISQADTGAAVWGDVWFTAGGAFTPTAGAVLSGWFIRSPDGGTTLEKHSAVPPRAPDFVIPLPNVALVANDVFYASGLVRLPNQTASILLQNNAGVAFSASGHKITFGALEIVA
jgi:hypothetical protein